MPCSRELSEVAVHNVLPGLAGDAVNDVVIRQLKLWIVAGMHSPNRQDHMSPTHFPRVVPLAELPSADDLDSQLAAADAERRRLRRT